MFDSTTAVIDRPVSALFAGVETTGPGPELGRLLADTDLDHHHPWADNGPTTETNLGPLCRHDHNLKHHNNWKLKPLAPGQYQWTSPLGHTYTTGPDPP
jgi:HNH endonuclease